MTGESKSAHTGTAQSRAAQLTRALAGDRRDLNNGFGHALNNAVELSVTPAIFAFLGWRLDLFLGTTPLFLVTFFVFVVSYVAWRLFRTYDADMRVEEERFKPRTGRTSS